jgi:hypothetical protein
MLESIEHFSAFPYLSDRHAFFEVYFLEAVWILVSCLSASAAFLRLQRSFCSRSFRILSFLFSSLSRCFCRCCLCFSFSLLFFYSRIALSFTIKAALYNASVMLSGE